MAVNPERETRLVWPVSQSYASGEIVEWAGPEDSDRPASATEIRAPADGTSVGMPLVLGVALLALVSLAVALDPLLEPDPVIRLHEKDIVRLRVE